MTEDAGANARCTAFFSALAGGATAAHITSLASEIGIETIVLPKLASGLCAFGQIISDVKYNYMATAPTRLDNSDAYQKLDDLFKTLEGQGVARLLADRFGKDRIVTRRSLEMRYVGQVHECTVDIETFDIDASTIERIKNAPHPIERKIDPLRVQRGEPRQDRVDRGHAGA